MPSRLFFRMYSDATVGVSVDVTEDPQGVVNQLNSGLGWVKVTPISDGVPEWYNGRWLEQVVSIDDEFGSAA